MRILLFLLLLFSFARAQNNYMLSFDAASSEYASVATTAVSDQTGFFSFWMVADNLTTFYFPIGFATTNSTTVFVRIDTRDNGKIRITQRDADVQDQVESSNVVLVAGTKYHIVFGSDGSDFLLWVDGVSQGLAVIGGSNSGDWIGDLTQSGELQAFGIGAKPGSSFAGFFPGDIDEVIYSSTTPTQEIISNIYNGGKPKDETTNPLYTTVHYWRLEEGSGTSSVDSKGSLNLTLTNTPTWIASVFGWDFGFKSFKKFSAHNKFKGF